MKAEHIIDAIGNLEESMLMESLPKKRRNFRPLAAVAILAAALCVTAGAAYLIAPEFFTRGDDYVVQMEYGGVEMAPEKLQELQTFFTQERAEDRLPLRHFDSFAALEADLGVDLLENPHDPVEKCHYSVDFEPNGHRDFFVCYYPWEKTAPVLDLQVSVMAYVTPDEGRTIGWNFPQELETQWSETTVYESETLDTAARIYCDKDGAQAWFVKDGIGYEVSCRGGVQVMQMVLDSFHY